LPERVELEFRVVRGETMSYQQKLEEARALLTQHNSQIPEDSKNRVNVDQFFTKLVAAGGTNNAGLSQCAWEDLQEFGLPKLLARQVAQIFRAKEEKKDEPVVLKRSKVEAMGVGELIAHYHPRNKNLIYDRLEEMLRNKRFVVYDKDGSVNCEASTKLANELLDDYPEREFYTLNDEPTKAYKVGERPDQSFDENPLYPGRVLRPDGDCDQTNRSWSGVSLEVRQTLYLAVKTTGEVRINSINDAHYILDLVVGKDEVLAVKTVRQRFVKASATLKEMYKQGTAPSLKIFKKPSDGGTPNNPFGAHVKY
jgi:hypothetical protein